MSDYKRVDGELVCVPSDGMWYTIERAEHDGRTWMEARDFGGGIMGGALMMSCRITDACVEGTGDEMLALAKAIESGDGASFTRCEAYPHQGGYALSSPRNSSYEALVPVDVAERLAANIRKVVTK